MDQAGMLADVTERLGRLEAESAIRRVMARYMELCDRLDETTRIGDLAALFTEDAVWAGRGGRYASAFGERHGRRAIADMFEGYCRPVPHFRSNVHFLTSETITVDGGEAAGHWILLQTATTADGRSDLRSARLDVRFALTDGAWRISRFETTNLFRRAVDRWDDATPVPTPVGEGA